MIRSLASTFALVATAAAAPLFAAAAEPPEQWATGVPIVTSILHPNGQYSPWQLLGRPNTLSRPGDTNPCSWAPSRNVDGNGVKNDSVVTIRLSYDYPVFARQVAVVQNVNPGSIERVTVISADEKQKEVVYEAVPQKSDKKYDVLHAIFPKTKFKVAYVELRLRPGMVDGWNEIDAVGLFTTPEPYQLSIDLADIDTAGMRRVNLGSPLNTEADELLPVVSPDGTMLFICRDEHPENIGRRKKSDIWFSTAQRDGNWSKPVNVGPPLNNDRANFVCSISPDGNTLLVGGVYDKAGQARPGVSVSSRTPDGWSEPVEVPIDDFINTGEFVSYFLANDNSTLLMVLERPGTYGGRDIFVSFRTDTLWTKPKNVGRGVNTAGNETNVFLAADMKTMYFSSEGYNGYGDMDIFVTERLDSTWLRWSEPKNMGPVVNSAGWDGYFSIPASGKYAYLSSVDNSYGRGDIFRVELPAKLRPKPVVLVSGTVTDSEDKKPLYAIIRYERLSDGTELGVANTNPVDGTFKIALPAGEQYGFRAEVEGYLSVNDNIDLRKLDSYQELERNLVLTKAKSGAQITANNLFFDSGKSALKKESIPELKRIAAFLMTNKQFSLRIVGHTDDVGSDAFNRTLSQNRAKAVERWLVGSGVPANRLSSEGKGKTQPVTTDPEQRALNRRVEFVLEEKP